MKQVLTHSTFTQKVAPLALGVLAMTLGIGSAQAKTINVDAGPIFNQFFANIQCGRVAAKHKGEWNGRYWTTPGTIDGVCQIVVPDPVSPKPVKRPPIQPAVTLKSLDAGKIWNEAHANSLCPQLAKKHNARWTGKWSEKTRDQPSYCQVEITKKPKTQKPRFKYINVEAGRIWSSEHANQHCKALAQKNKGTWTGKYTTKNNKSTCQIKVALANKKPKHRVKTPRSRNIREVSAGSIWGQNQANTKCPKIAKQVNGSWTGKWRKTGSNNQAVCEVRLQPLHTVKKPPHKAPPKPAPANNVRDVPAGPIWDQAQATKKCPLVAAQSGSSWTGKWRKLDYSTHQSVCQVSTSAAPAPAVPTKTVVTTTTTYVNLKPKPVTSSHVREIFAGPIWDGNQANTKCPIIAANNKGTWTGKWRKTGPDHSSLCEVRF